MLFPKEARTISKERSLKISAEFDNIINSFFEYIEERDVHINKLISSLLGRVRHPTIYEDDPQCTPADLNKVEDIPTFSKYFRSYCSFFNFTLLEDLMERLKYNDGLSLMKNYKKNFEKYLQEINISEIPHGIGADGDEAKLFVVELSDCFKSCRALFLNSLKADLSRLLCIHESCLQICIIKDSSVHVVFQVFRSLENVFPLSDKTKNAFMSLSYGDAQVIAIGYDGIVHNINRKGKCSGMRQMINYLAFGTCNS